MRWRAPSAAIALALLLAGVAQAAPAVQQDAGPVVAVYAMDSRDFPSVIAFLAVADAAGAPVVGLTPADLELLEDGQPIPDGPVTISSHTPSVAVALALDISVDFASFTQVQAAARDFVGNLGEDDQAAVIVYQSDVVVAQEFTSDQDSLTEAIDGLTAEGTATNLNRAVSQALTLLEDVDAQRKAVVVITNGGDTVGAVSTDSVVRQAQEGGVLVYTQVFAPTVNVNALGSMARQTGGRPFVLSGAGEVGQSLETIAAGLRQGYSVTFQSGLPADNAPHTLTVAVTVDGREAETETEFETFLVATPITLVLSVAEGQSVIGVVNLTAQVASSTPIAKVEYLLDGQPLAVLNSPPYSYQWDSAAAPAGLHILTARATDNGGRTGELMVTLDVAEITPLLVTALAPRSVESGSAVTVDAQVETTAPGVSVEFLLDGQVLGADAEPPYSLTFSSEAFEAGDHDITVRAVDALGRQAENNVSIQFTPRPVGFGERVGTFVGSLARYKRLAFTLVLAFLILVVLLAAILLVRMNGRTRQRRLQRTCRLEIVNAGNARSRFELWADDPGKALKFQFALDGEVLAVRQPAAEQPAPAAARQPAQPTAARPAPAPAKSGGGRQAADRAWTISSAVSDLLNTVSYFLPGSAGRGAYQAGAGIREAQYTGSRVQSVSGQIADVKGAAGAPQATQAAPPPATIIEPPPDPTRPGPVAPPRKPRADGHPWVETPYVEPGETLALNLLVDRLRTSGIQQYPFRVLSRCMESPDKPTVEQATIEIGRLPPLLSLMPILVLLVAAGIVLLLIALMLAPPGFVS